MKFDHYTDQSVTVAVDLANSIVPGVDEPDSRGGPRASEVEAAPASPASPPTRRTRGHGPAETSAAGATGGLADLAALRRFLDEHGLRPGRLSTADLDAVRAFVPRLRAVFHSADAAAAARLLNTLLAEVRALPQLSDHDGETWHLHFTPPDAPVAQRLAAVACMGLATVVADWGTERFRICASDTCVDVFVDESKNSSRRFCSDGCANKSHVRAFRARQRAAGDA